MDRIIGVNSTETWLRWVGRAYLADAACQGLFSFGTAFSSACDQRSLPERLAVWDTKRASYSPLSPQPKD